MTAERDIHIVDGGASVLRLYDIAYGIDLARVTTLLHENRDAGAHRRMLRHTDPKAVAFDVPPVQLSLGHREVMLAGSPVPVSVTVRLYDFGALTIALRFPLTDLPGNEYVRRVNEIGRWAAGGEAALLWSEMRAHVIRMIAPALDRPASTHLEEDYLIATVQRFGTPVASEEIPRALDLARLLSGEDTKPLSAGTRSDLLKHRYSFYEDDLAVLTWDRAFLYEPEGDTDVAGVIEVANAQLLELRYFDETLDRQIPDMYQRVEKVRSSFGVFSRTRLTRLARELDGMLADVTELRERADNAIQVTEDVYLARIYATALDLFRIRAWASAVDRKMSIVKDTCRSLLDEAASLRAELLEATIVLLILFEIVMSFIH